MTSKISIEMQMKLKALLASFVAAIALLGSTAGAESVFPYTCRQLEAMPNSSEVLCRLAELGDVVEIQKRVLQEPALANTLCTVNARYYGKYTVNNTLFTLTLAARDFWDHQDLNIFRERHYPALCLPGKFKFRVDELEATALFLSTVIDPNAVHQVGQKKPPYGERSNIKTLCDFSFASGNQYIPHSKVLDQIELNLFNRGAIFHGYCGYDSKPHD
jgi:hypothetical protein